MEPTSELLELLKAKKMIYELLLPIGDELAKYARDLQTAINNAGGGNKKQPVKKMKPNKTKAKETKPSKPSEEPAEQKSQKATKPSEEPAEQKSQKATKPAMPEIEDDFVIN
jgi:outer membrane biosynthesis protein TonB